jgi:PAS domain-containing protein
MVVPPDDEARAAHLTALGELEIASGARRLAEEEAERQRAQLEELVAQHLLAHHRDHVALSPVCVLRTDAFGTVQTADGAAAAVLDVPAHQIVGEPLPSFFDEAHKPAVRASLERLARDRSEDRLLVVVRPRQGRPRVVQLVGLRHPDDPPDSIRWVVIPRAAESDAAEDPDDPDAPADAAGQGRDDGVELVAALARVCTEPWDDDEPQRSLSRLATVVCAAIPGASAVSITVGSPAQPEQVAADSADAQRFDGVQFRCGEGPCLEAYTGDAVVVADDVRHDPRWPRLVSAVQEEPIRSVLALPLRPSVARGGVVNVYAGQVAAFPARAARIGEVVAGAVVSVLDAAAERASLRELARNLERALASRAAIEQAKGIVMAHHGGTPEEAFARLVAYSNRHNIKLRDLASLLVAGGGQSPPNGL